MEECFLPHRATALVDTAAIAENFRLLAAHCRQERPQSSAKHAPFRLISVVKADAYGHGVALVVPALLAAGCDFFAVATFLSDNNFYALYLLNVHFVPLLVFIFFYTTNRTVKRFKSVLVV